MLQLDLHTIPFTADHHCSPEEYWRVIRRSFLHVHRLWKNPPSFARKVGIPTICDSTIDDGGLLEASELVALQRVEVTELVLTVVEEDPSTIANQLSTLMRELVRVDTVRKMMWSFKRCDRQFLEAIYSAIPAMKSLETFSVLCDDLKTTDETTVQVRSEDTQVRSYYAWLGYALAMRQVDGRSASVGVDLMSGNEELFGRALQSPSALLDGIS
jgi:hypothetical protein